MMAKDIAVCVETYSDEFHNDVVEIVSNFYDEAIKYYDVGLTKEVLFETIKALKGSAFLLIVDGKCQGLLAGMEAPSMLNDKRKYQEVIWYVNKPFRRYGIGLLNKVQELLKAQGFSTMIMAVLEASKTRKLKRFYERMGYKKFETHYIKEI